MDYFNEEERSAQESFRQSRDSFLNPIVSALIALKVTANQISFLGIVFLAVACILPPKDFLLAALLILLYCAMDGLDGPLARKLGESHEGGSIVDMLVDQLGVIAIPAAAIWHLGASGVGSLLFSTGYLLLIVLVVLENELEEYKQRNFFRIKYWVYGLYGIQLYMVDATYLNYVFAIAAVYYWIEVYLRTLSIHAYFKNRA